LLDIIQRTYAAARPDLPEAQINAVVVTAAMRAKAKHPDWEHFAPAIEFLATAFFTDHRSMPLDDYLETLYCAVKHGDFSREWRKKLRGRAPALVQPIEENDPPSV
jgi:hypothetical protein